MMEDKRMNLLQEVQAVDREVADAITAEMERQNSHRSEEHTSERQSH